MLYELEGILDNENVSDEDFCEGLSDVLVGIDNVFEKIGFEVLLIGVRLNVVEFVYEINLDLEVVIKDVCFVIQDVDYVEVFVEFVKQEVVLIVVLLIFFKIFNLSLFNYF